MVHYWCWRFLIYRYNSHKFALTKDKINLAVVAVVANASVTSPADVFTTVVSVVPASDNDDDNDNMMMTTTMMILRLWSYDVYDEEQ